MVIMGVHLKIPYDTFGVEHIQKKKKKKRKMKKFLGNKNIATIFCRIQA